MGYNFYRYKGKCRFRVHPKLISKMKEKIRELTDGNNGMRNEKRKKISTVCERLVEYL